MNDYKEDDYGYRGVFRLYEDVSLMDIGSGYMKTFRLWI